MTGFCENLVCDIFDKYFHRTNLPLSLRPITSFDILIERSLCTCATNKKNHSLKPLLRMRRAHPCTHCMYTYIRLLIKVELSEVNTKIERRVNLCHHKFLIMVCGSATTPTRGKRFAFSSRVVRASHAVREYRLFHAHFTHLHNARW